MPVVNFADLLIAAVERRASDLYVTTGYPPMLRVHGTIVPLDAAHPPLSRDEVHNALYDVMKEEQRKKLERDCEVDFAIELSGVGRFRANVFYGRLGEAGVFRHIPGQILTFDDLLLPAKTLQSICNRRKGLVLVTGPTGSGKSTTLAAMIHYINQTRQEHIITIEDPIEFVHDSIQCVIHQREVGTHTHSFAHALRSALREDPDVILVGEMRDLETISLALTAAETGHLVFATLHTMSAPKTVDRIIDVFPPAQQQQIRVMLAEALNAVISQVLLKRQDGQGRIAALEIMIATAAVRSLIREAKTHQMATIIQTSQRLGMQGMDQALKDLVMRGKVSRQDALEFSQSPNLFGGEGGEGGAAGGYGPQIGGGGSLYSRITGR
ncbi:MAG: type IV pilus twitching motility protein PilT [Candidatus Sumerlaeia bacterium]